ncbi:PKD domain-containing protein [Actinokineospora alba]|uniref:PKD domain-containing protein n=1 Tax=Actinokineospora alba TaxID=504798 RepID=UPI00105C2F99|nr:PKD domain-containing protein [Actinokineospora alba]
MGPLAVRPAMAESSVLYVSNTSGCSDSGVGSSAQPFCTAQAAADVVEPGQTVKLDRSDIGRLTITRSGTEAAPIVFEGGFIRGAASDTVPALLIHGAHDIVVRGTETESSSDTQGLALRVARSSRVMLEALTVRTSWNTSTARGLLIDDGSSAVTLRRSSLWAKEKTLVVNGANDVTIAGNVTGDHGTGIELVNAPRVAIAGNTIKNACYRAIGVFGDATGTSIQNNIINGIATSGNTSCRPASTEVHGVVVDIAAAQGVITDYNIVYAWGKAYAWSGRTYPFSKDLHAVTGQAAHDFNNGPDTNTNWIDSANADAPGQLPTDRSGVRPVDQPQVANTGVGKVATQDRGATESTDRVTGSFAQSATKAPVGGQVRFEGSFTSSWNIPVTCDIDFGDGTLIEGACSATHAYTQPGTYTVRATASTDGGSVEHRSSTIQVVQAGGALMPTLTVTASNVMGVVLRADGGGTPWNIAKVEFQTGESTRTVEGTALHHRYYMPGTYTVRATVTDAGGNTATTAATEFTTVGSGLVPYGPTRLLDTRVGTGGTTGKIKPYSGIRLAVAGQGGIPAGVTAVAMNVAVTDPTTSGHIIAYPSGAARPLASTLNFVAGQTVPNMAILPVGPDGAVEFYNAAAGTVHLIADVTGYFARTAGVSGFESVVPSRVLDSRTGLGTPDGGAKPLPGGGTWTQDITIQNVPDSATAVLLNVAVTNPAASGHVTVFPAGGGKPLASNLNYVAGQTVSNAVLVPVGTGGAISYFSTTRTDLVVDVVGYATESNAYRKFFAPLTPTRVVDTRIGTGQSSAHALAPRSSEAFDLVPGSQIDIPEHAVANVTVVNPKAAGFLSAYPSGLTPPTASTLNFQPGAVVGNLAVVRDPVAFHNGSDGSLDLVVDLTGYLSYN